MAVRARGASCSARASTSRKPASARRARSSAGIASRASCVGTSSDERNAGRQRAHQRDEVELAFAGEASLGARLDRIVVGRRAGPRRARRRAARSGSATAGSARDVVDAAARARQVERVDEDAAVRTRRALDDARGLHEVLRVGPRHELEVRGHAVARREVAELREAVGQARLVGIVAGDEQVLSRRATRRSRSPARSRRRRACRASAAGSRRRAPATPVASSRARVSRTIGVSPIIGCCGSFGGRGDQAQADVRVAGRGGRRHEVGRRELERRERGERDRAAHAGAFTGAWPPRNSRLRSGSPSSSRRRAGRARGGPSRAPARGSRT